MVRVLLGTFGVERSLALAAREIGTVVIDASRRGMVRADTSAAHYVCIFSVSFLMLLSVVTGGIVSNKEICEFMYGDRSDGGPIGAGDNVIMHHLYKLRSRLLQLGLMLRVHYGQGVELIAHDWNKRGTG